MRRIAICPVLAIMLAPPSVLAQAASTPPASALAAIAEADLKRDLYVLAGDSMRGREAGTLDEMRASMWIADQLRRIGVEPMGDNGTYFQWWHIRRTRLGASSVVRLGARAFTLWDDIAVVGNNEADVSAALVWAGDGMDTTIDVRGKIAMVQITTPPAVGRETTVNSAEYRYATRAMQYAASLVNSRGAAAVVLVADSITDIAFEGVRNIRARGAYAVDGMEGGRGGGGRGAAGAAPIGTGAACGGPPLEPDAAAGRGAAGGGRAGGGGGGRGGGGGGGGGGRAGGFPVAGAGGAGPVLLVRASMRDQLRALSGQAATVRLHRESFTYPSVNIVGRVRGTDAALRDEYVLFSSHQDHDGVRYTVAGDSIWNGADDNGTVSVALLGIARAFVRQPARRSALFVYHGAEERGLLGSRYHAANPVVPLRNIVTVLNGDMLGRNSPDSASIMGVQPPHMNSRDLVAHALRANDLTGKFKLDSIWDRPTHVEGWYRRSDHLPYAQACVPALMYSANLHPDYHTPRDEPATIDYAKVTRIARWMYATGWLVGNAERRPALEPVFDIRR